MRALILAGGYGTRLQGLIGDKPKALADIQGKTVLDRLLTSIEPVVDQIALISNRRYFLAFKAWRNTASRPVELYQNASMNPDDRLGALGDLALLLSWVGDGEPALVLASDTILTGSIEGLIAQYQSSGCSQIAIWRNPDKQDQRRRGVVQLGHDRRVVKFTEKPASPNSDIAASPIYVFTPTALAALPKYLAAGGASDAPGSYIEVLCQHERVEGWWLPSATFDVGNPTSFEVAQTAGELKSPRANDEFTKPRP